MDRLDKHFAEVIEQTWNFSGRVDTDEREQMNALVGLAAESGEALDVGKKLWFHSQFTPEMAHDKLLSEFGDIFYYLLKSLEVFGFSVDEVLAYNRKKLESRHPELGKVEERFGKDAIRG